MNDRFYDFKMKYADGDLPVYRMKTRCDVPKLFDISYSRSPYNLILVKIETLSSKILEHIEMFNKARTTNVAWSRVDTRLSLIFSYLRSLTGDLINLEAVYGLDDESFVIAYCNAFETANLLCNQLLHAGRLSFNRKYVRPLIDAIVMFDDQFRDKFNDVNDQLDDPDICRKYLDEQVLKLKDLLTKCQLQEVDNLCHVKY